MTDRSAADRLFEQANSQLSSASGGFFSFGSKTDKYEQASDKFKDAANLYRTNRDMQKSGQCFERAAEIQLKNLNEPLEGARLLQDAYKSYKESSPSDAVRCIDQSIQLYTAKGNFRRAADLMCDLADLQEKMGDFPKALSALETAITWYTDEGIPATANKARQKAGQLAAESGDYYKAISIFVTGAKASLTTGPTGRFSVKTYLFKAGLCQLATGDTIGAKKAFESWNEIDRGFDQEREGRFLRDLLETMEARDADRFGQLAQQWDAMTKMEEWQVTVLLAARSHSEAPEEEDFS